jgi:LuxR family maltose regulon positive regulatory protein
MAAAPGVAPPFGIVARPTLVARLERTPAGGVVLIEAPAGSGKTTLIRCWQQASPHAAAWVSIERDETDAQHFWSIVVRALQDAVGSDAIRRLPSSPSFDGRGAVERLRAELALLDQNLVLIIDDLHELASPAAIQQLEGFLEVLPDRMRVVLAFRGPLRLRLHRLRLAGALTDIRAAELMFTLEEARELLARSGIVLAEEDLLRLHQRTEGWAAGLRLAALSLSGHQDPARFVTKYSGTERTVADYLVSEVLERQPPNVRRLLLRTSLLERINGPLADAVTGGSDGQSILQALYEAGAFVATVQGGGSWFRYHHLLADLLRLELRRSEPEAVADVHRAAARWFLRNGDVPEAVAHAQAAGDWSMAVDLMAHHYFSLTLDGRQATARGLLRSFPRAAMARDPELALVLGADELSGGSLDRAGSHLAVAMRHADAVPEERQRRFQVGLALVRLSLARRRGDFESVRDLIASVDFPHPPQTWLDITMHDDLRVWTLMNLGIVEVWSTRSAEGALHLEQACQMARAINRPYLEVACLANRSFGLAGESLRKAEAACRDAVEVAERHGWGADPVVAPALVTLATCLVTTGELDEAEQWLGRAEQTLRVEVDPAVGCLIYGVRAAVLLVRRRIEEAIACSMHAAELGARLVNPPTALDRFRVVALQALRAFGQTAEVKAALRRMTADERDKGEIRELLAELAITEEDWPRALEVLTPILDGTARVDHITVMIRAHLLEAVVRNRMADAQAAEAAIERALDIAETERLIMPFVQSPAVALLRDHPRHRTAHGAFLAEILDRVSALAPAAVASGAAHLCESLSEVERRVLRFLPSHLTAPEIGQELEISANTVKTHMRHIYAKLDAHSRTQALGHARALGLLAPNRPVGNSASVTDTPRA